MPRAILLVDDDPALRTVVADVLRDAGYAVREASNGLAALGAVETCPRTWLCPTCGCRCWTGWRWPRTWRAGETPSRRC